MATKSVLIAELDGPALSWSVGTLSGQALHILEPVYGTRHRIFALQNGRMVRYRPYVDWETGGHIVDALRPQFVSAEDNMIQAHVGAAVALGPTHLVAMCRAYVTMMSPTDHIQVPAQLVYTEDQLCRNDSLPNVS